MIDDFQLPIAELRRLSVGERRLYLSAVVEIGNRQSAIGNNYDSQA
jgi:hypothetical protein